jgi:hypothetical protein
MPSPLIDGAGRRADGGDPPADLAWRFFLLAGAGYVGIDPGNTAMTPRVAERSR